MSEGLHKVRIYGMHAGLGVERLVISNKDIKESYLGPDKTFMLDYDIIPEASSIPYRYSRYLSVRRKECR